MDAEVKWFSAAGTLGGDASTGAPVGSPPHALPCLRPTRRAPLGFHVKSILTFLLSFSPKHLPYNFNFFPKFKIDELAQETVALGLGPSMVASLLKLLLECTGLGLLPPSREV